MIINTEIGENVEMVDPVEPGQRPLRVRSSAAAEALTQAHVALVEYEVITRAQNPDVFRLVNNQFATLQNWHDLHTGWRIRRSPAVIRLVRTPSAFIPGYVFRTLYKPRDFALFVWTLWYAESRAMAGRGNEQQFLMSQMAEQLEEQTHSGRLAVHVPPLDFRRQDDRYSLARALKALQDLGGLQLVDGGAEDWVTQTGENDALWEFTEVTRSLLLALDMQKVLTAGQRLDGDPHTINPALLTDQQVIEPLQRAWRVLLLGPVLFHYDDGAAFIALWENSEMVRRNLAETFGWELDLRYEYAQVVRASGTTQGPITLLSLKGAADQAALLICDVVRQRITSGDWRPQMLGTERDGCFLVAEGEISEIFRQVRERYEVRWGNTARKEGFHRLLQDVYAKLRQAGLMRGPDQGGNILLLPTMARYAVAYSRQDEEEGETITTASSAISTHSQEVAAQIQLDFGSPNQNQAGPTTINGNREYTPVEVGKIIGLSDRVVINRIKAGLIKAEKRGQKWFIPAKEVEKLMVDL